jgi:hypothetical protein
MARIKIEDLPENVKLDNSDVKRAFGGGMTVFANSLSIAHRGYGGLALGFPDICATPPSPPGGPVPVPYPNFGSAADTTKRSRTTK